jgi:hypothetical protein
VVWFRGMKWRQERSKRELQREREKSRSRGGSLEAGVGAPEQSTGSREKVELVTSRPLVSERRQSSRQNQD